MKISRIFQGALLAVAVGSGNVFAQEAQPPAVSTAAAAPQEGAVDELAAKVAAVGPSEWTAEKINAIPKRDVEFVESSEVLKSTSSRHDPYLDAKFVAVFHVEVPPQGKVTSDINRNHSNRQDLPLFSPEHDKTYAVRLTSGANSDALLGHYFGSKLDSNANQWSVVAKRTLKPVIEQLPADTLSQEELAYVSAPTVLGTFFIRQEQIQHNEEGKIIGPTEQKKASFIVYGDSPEEIKQRVLALLKLIDYGYTRPLQLALASDRQVQLERLQDLSKQLQLSEKERIALQEESKGIAKLSTEELNVDLQSLKFQAEVEIASCNARLAAYKQKLADLPPDSPRVQQLEGFQTSVEIELIGHQVRAAKIKEQMDKVAAVKSIDQRLTYSVKKIAVLKRQTNTALEVIQSFDTELRRYAPLKVVDNKIKLSPHQGEFLSGQAQR